MALSAAIAGETCGRAVNASFDSHKTVIADNGDLAVSDTDNIRPAGGFSVLSKHLP